MMIHSYKSGGAMPTSMSLMKLYSNPYPFRYQFRPLKSHNDTNVLRFLQISCHPIQSSKTTKYSFSSKVPINVPPRIVTMLVQDEEMENGSDEVVVEKDQVEKEEEVDVQVEPKTGVAFPIKLEDGKVLNSVGMRKKSIFGLGVKIYAFGIYSDKGQMKELLRLKAGKAPAKPTKEIYQAVIDSEVEIIVRVVLVFGGLTMNMVKKNFDEGLGASIRKLNGGQKNEELSSKMLGSVPDNIKASSGTLIEVTKLPGYTLQSKVKEEIVSTVQSELLCRAYLSLYLGDDPFDREAKERFGESVLSLFEVVSMNDMN